MTDIHPIKEMIYISVFDTSLPWLLILFLVAFIFVVILFFYKKKQTKDVLIPVYEPEVSVDEIVSKYEKRLLNKKDLTLSGDLYEFSLVASEIIKECLSEVYKIKIKELTTAEIKNINIFPRKVHDAVLHFLSVADLKKFSNHISDGKKYDMFETAMKVLEIVKEDAISLEEDKNGNNVLNNK